MLSGCDDSGDSLGSYLPGWDVLALHHVGYGFPACPVGEDHGPWGEVLDGLVSVVGEHHGFPGEAGKSRHEDLVVGDVGGSGEAHVGEDGLLGLIVVGAVGTSGVGVDLAAPHALSALGLKTEAEPADAGEDVAEAVFARGFLGHGVEVLMHLGA